MEQELIQLIQTVKEFSPEMWNIALAQVRAEMFVSVIGVVFNVVLTVLIAIAVIRTAERAMESDGGTVLVLFLCIIIVMNIASIFFLLRDIVFKLVSPEFQAIKIIMALTS